MPSHILDDICSKIEKWLPLHDKLTRNVAGSTLNTVCGSFEATDKVNQNPCAIYPKSYVDVLPFKNVAHGVQLGKIKHSDRQQYAHSSHAARDSI